MFSSPDFLLGHAPLLPRTRWLGAVAGALLAAGCASPSCPHADAARVVTAAPTVVVSPAPPAADAVAHLLAYAERVRLMPPEDLSQEAIRLGDAAGPTAQVQLALILSQQFQLPELLRAQELLGRVLADQGAQAQTLHALAGLLASRYVELRRMEEQFEKQTQLTREVQRRLDQTHERMEALKAIERSLPSRPPAAASSSAPSRRGARVPAP